MTTYTATEDHVTIPFTLAAALYAGADWPLAETDSDTVAAALNTRARTFGFDTWDAVDTAAVPVEADRVTLAFETALHWFMASDPSPLDDDDEATVIIALDARARELGYDSWVVAFHEWAPAGPTLTVVR